jgi:hypothetical protein
VITVHALLQSMPVMLFKEGRKVMLQITYPRKASFKCL